MPPRERQSDIDLDRKFEDIAPDVAQIVDLPISRVMSLIDVFSKLEPFTNSIDGRDVNDWAVKNGLAPEEMLALLRLAQFVQNDIPPEESTVDKLVERFKSVEGAKSQLRQILDKFLPVAKRLDEKIEEAGALAWYLPSFDGCRIACDLRFTPQSKEYKASFAPLAIVRIQLDEGRPLLFQCNAAALLKLSTILTEAVNTISELGRIADDRLRFE